MVQSANATRQFCGTEGCPKQRHNISSNPNLNPCCADVTKSPSYVNPSPNQEVAHMNFLGSRRHYMTPTQRTQISFLGCIGHVWPKNGHSSRAVWQQSIFISVELMRPDILRSDWSGRPVVPLLFDLSTLTLNGQCKVESSSLHLTYFLH